VPRAGREAVAGVFHLKAAFWSSFGHENSSPRQFRQCAAAGALPARLRRRRGVGGERERVVPFPEPPSAPRRRGKRRWQAAAAPPAHRMLPDGDGRTDRRARMGLRGGGGQPRQPPPSHTVGDATSGSAKRGRKRKTNPKPPSNFPSPLIAPGGAGSRGAPSPWPGGGDPQITGGPSCLHQLGACPPSRRELRHVLGVRVPPAVVFTRSQKEGTWPLLPSELAHCPSAVLPPPKIILLGCRALALGKYSGALHRALWLRKTSPSPRDGMWGGPWHRQALALTPLRGRGAGTPQARARARGRFAAW